MSGSDGTYSERCGVSSYCAPATKEADLRNYFDPVSGHIEAEISKIEAVS